MGLGVLEDGKLEHVPGTATLQDIGHSAAVESRHANLKRSPNGTILVPQPSDSPDDPLNWPLKRRDCITGILCLLSVIASTLSPLLACNTLYLDLWFKKSFTAIALLTGYHLLGVGVAGFIFVASARVWGKRHLYLLGAIIIIVSSAWGGASGHNYNSLLAARFFQGIGLAPFEALVNATVGDLYFVHERGKRMALTNLSLFGGAFFTPVIVGKITGTLGWQWTFYLIAIFTAAMFPLVVFLVPETAYVRDAAFNTDLAIIDEQSIDNDSKLTSAPAAPVPSKWVSKQNMRIFNGRKTDESFWKLLLRPFPLFFHPAVLWACLIQGTLIGWTVLLGIVIAYLAFTPPILFNEVQTGYLYAGAFIGAFLGFIIAGLLSDSSARLLTKRNRGIYEPEFRLPLVIPQLIFGCAGLYGFGIVSANAYEYGWFWPDFFFSLEVLGMVIGAVASALYIVDAHRDITVEAFTCMLIFKNIFSFGLTFSGFHWLQQSGFKTVFYAVASVQVFICCLTIPLYVLGKRNRSFFARHDLFKVLDPIFEAFIFLRQALNPFRLLSGSRRT